jgi:hypothetical protein
MKQLYWILVAFLAWVVGNQLLAFPSTTAKKGLDFCPTATCETLLPILTLVGDLNTILGVFCLVLLVLRSPFAIYCSAAFLTIHLTTDAPFVYYNFIKFGSVWIEQPYLWEAIRLGWPIAALCGVFFVRSYANKGT